MKIEGALERNYPEMKKEDIDKTLLLTIHGSKGMEADSVFLHTAINPTIKKAMYTQKGVENEAYTWYVGITRTKKNLFFVTYTGNNYPLPGVCA